MLALLQQADSVFVNFDPRRDGVVVPAHLKRQPRVVLQYGLNMRIPIPDLDVGEEGIGATLSFDRAPTWTFVPWSAVYLIATTQGRGVLYQEDVPGVLETKIEPPAKDPVAEVDAALAEARRAMLEARGIAVEEAEERPAPRGRPTLRLVN